MNRLSIPALVFYLALIGLTVWFASQVTQNVTEAVDQYKAEMTR